MSDHKDILDLDVKFRHIKMWLLHKRGLSRKEIAELLGGTNPGAVGNEIKKYEADKIRQFSAEQFLLPKEEQQAKIKAAVERIGAKEQSAAGKVSVNDIFKNKYNQALNDDLKYYFVMRFGKKYDDINLDHRKDLWFTSDTTYPIYERDVPIEDIYPGQEYLFDQHLEAKKAGDVSHSSSIPLGLIMSTTGKVLLFDGHHRVAADIIAGKSTSKIRLIEVFPGRRFLRLNKKEERKAARPISRATNAPSNPPDSSPAYLMTAAEYTKRVVPILTDLKKFSRKIGWERSKNESGYKNYYGVTLDVSNEAGPALHIYNKYISELREFFSQRILDSQFDKDEWKSNKRSVRRAIDDGTYEELLNSNPDLLPKIEAAAASVGIRLPQRLTNPRGNAITPAMYESLFSEIPSVNREILKELVKNVEASFKDFEEEIRQDLDSKYRAEIKRIQAKDEIRAGEVNRPNPMVWGKLGAPSRVEKVKDKHNLTKTIYYYKVPPLAQNWESILANGIESEISEMKMPMLRSILQNFEKITKRIKRFEKNDVRKEKGVFSGSFTFYFEDGSQFTFESKAIYAGGYNIQKLHLRYISDFSNARDAAGNKLSSKSLYEILLNFSDDKNKDAVANIYDRIDAAESVDKIIRELYEEIKKGRIKGLESPRANVRSLGYSIWEKQRKRSRALYFDGATGKGIMPLAEAKEKAITFLEGWGVEKASAIEKGAAVEAEHGKLYDEIVARLKAKGATMPMSREEFFKEIASAHLAEKKDYYELLEKYVEKHTPAGNSVGLKLPPSLKRKIDEYKSKGWFYGPLMETFLSKVDVKKLSDALTRTLKYANKSASHFGITNYQKKPMLEFVEIDEWDGNKFEKAPDYVPYLENVGDDVLFSYGTAAGTSDKPFLIWDIEDFIKLNPSRRPPTDEDSKYRGGGERLAGTGTKLNPANASTPEGGGLLVGVKHTPQGRGIEVETPEGKIKAEGGEILLNAKTSERLCEQLSAESVKDGGVAFPCEKTDSVQGPMKGGGGQLGGGGQISKDAKWALDMGDKTSYIDMLERHKDDTNLTPLQKQKIKFALEMRDEIYLRDALQHMAGDGTKTGIVPQDNPEGYDFTIEKITDWDDDGNPISKKTIKHFQLEKDAKKAFFKAVDRYGVNWGSIEFYHGIADASDDEIILKIRPSSKPDSAQGPMAGNGGMAGAGDKINETNFKITTHEINDILSGKIKVRHGDSIQSAKALVGGSSGAQKSPQSEKPKRKEESRIRESGALLPSMFERSDAVFIDSGAEQSVYLKGDIVIKENTGVFYNTWEDYLNSLLLHNYFFEDTAYQFLGFEDVDGDINAIVSQPFVDTENKVNEDELFEFLKNKGFENTSGHDFEHPETGLILEDLHDENVIEKDGLLFFIDTVFFLPKSMSGDGTKIPVAAWTMPSGRIHHYAESIKNNHPKIWSTGGNEFGNQAYENLSRVLERGYWLQEEEEMYKRWRSFIARHQHDKRLPGIIANLKWLNFPNIGEDAAKEVIAEAVNKRMNGDGASIELKPYYTLTKEETIAERDAGTTRRGELNRHSIAEWGLILDELK